VLGEEGGEALGSETLGALRGGEAAEKCQRDPAVDLGEDGGGAGPEALEQAPEPVGEADAGGDEVVAAAGEGAQRLDLVGDGRERREAMAVGAQDVGEEVGVAGVGLPPGGAVARAAGLHGVGVDGHDGMAGGDERLDDEARGPLDGDGQRLRRAEALQHRDQVGETGGVVADVVAQDDRSPVVDDADGMAGGAPVEAGEERGGAKGHRRDLQVGVTLARVGRSCGSLIGRRSGWQALAQHPVVRRVLPAPAARRVSRRPSQGERRRPSRQPLGWAEPYANPRRTTRPP
jgi:hypothetical protein